MPYIVTFHSAGCLPDSEPYEFDTLREAAQHVAGEAEESCLQAMPEIEVDANVPGLQEIESARGLQDPTPGSPYRWNIEQVRA